MLRVAAHAPVEAADRRLGGPVGVDLRIRRPGDLLEELRVAVLGARIDERVVDLERRVARLERDAVLVLLLGRQRRVGGLGVRELRDDLGGADGGRAERDLVGAAQDLAAGGLHERVEPHGVALVGGALDLDPPGLGQARRRVDQLVPRRRRLVDEVLAVPQQLRVGVRRRAVEPAVVGRGLERPRERPLAHLAGHVLGPRQDPLGLGELRGPDDVHAHEVDRGVLGGEAADERLALRVGVVAERVEDDPVAPVRLLRAPVGGLPEGARRLVVGPPVQPHGAAGAVVRSARSGKQRACRECDGTETPQDPHPKFPHLQPGAYTGVEGTL